MAPARVIGKRKDRQRRPNVQFVISASSGARLWIIVCALASAMTPLVGRAADWQMSGNDLTNDRYRPHETSIDVNNVAILKPAWTFNIWSFGSVGNDIFYAFQPTPLLRTSRLDSRK